MIDTAYMEAFRRDIEAQFEQTQEKIASLQAEVTQLRTAPDRDALYSAKDVAARLGVSERTVRQMIADKVLPSVKTGGLTKVEPAAVDAYLERQRGVGSPVRRTN